MNVDLVEEFILESSRLDEEQLGMNRGRWRQQVGFLGFLLGAGNKVLLDDVKVSDQLVDLVFYVLLVLNDYRQDIHDSDPVPVLHSSLVACSLYLLIGCISSQWQDLALVMITHPKVDMLIPAPHALKERMMNLLYHLALSHEVGPNFLRTSFKSQFKH
ncbi:hypothetical protein F3Y22_tig00005974pilonHSYRG00308 [Hibiscus syriacus]|uniref:Nodulin homeobox N-terminal domain-containing protein n=1 Tax=Hibiscus syriacus TaxID=106335 RepID=A0A6A3CHE4_HIBSY|nr:hypothetical protein F3Y22_tig00005974pilonHSYRG00308 [Hibiscus syriacus]